MLKLFRKGLKNQKGFTLVELMVVVVIIGVLVAIAVPVYNSTTSTAKKNACLANIRTFEGAVETAAANGVDKTTITKTGDLVPTYLKTDIKCPFGDTTFPYEVDKGVITHHSH